jgi:hypothetical protein
MADIREGREAGTSAKAGKAGGRGRIGEGPGRLLVSVYAVFTAAAGSRSLYQLIAQFHQAPLAYLLSALAAVVYAFITVALARGGESARRLALACCTAELAGVLVVGTLTVAVPSAFPDQTVWSNFGMGYLFIPVVLPVAGIRWLREPAPRRDRGATEPTATADGG